MSQSSFTLNPELGRCEIDVRGIAIAWILFGGCLGTLLLMAGVQGGLTYFRLGSFTIWPLIQCSLGGLALLSAFNAVRHFKLSRYNVFVREQDLLVVYGKDNVECVSWKQLTDIGVRSIRDSIQFNFVWNSGTVSAQFCEATDAVYDMLRREVLPQLLLAQLNRTKLALPRFAGEPEAEVGTAIWRGSYELSSQHISVGGEYFNWPSIELLLSLKRTPDAFPEETGPRPTFCSLPRFISHQMLAIAQEQWITQMIARYGELQGIRISPDTIRAQIDGSAKVWQDAPRIVLLPRICERKAD